MNRKLRLLICSFLFLTIIYILVVHYQISATAKQIPPKDADYLVVLGAKINGEEMSLALHYRVLIATQYLKENPTTQVVVSGGQGPGESITEAEAMKRYLLNEGIEEQRILTEDQSTTTFENLSFSKELLDSTKQVIIVSSDFHLYRSTIIANRLGYEQIYTLPAKTPWVVKPKLWIREYAAVLKTLMVDR
ncbi:YdcF family protein [Bacillus sp. AK128]